MDLDKNPVVRVKRRSDYPPHFLNFKRAGIDSVCFSDAMCLESLDSGWTSYSPPVGGGSISREHFLKIDYLKFSLFNYLE